MSLLEQHCKCALSMRGFWISFTLARDFIEKKQPTYAERFLLMMRDTDLPELENHCGIPTGGAKFQLNVAMDALRKENYELAHVSLTEAEYALGRILLRKCGYER